MTALILASQSPRRRDLLQALGITFEVQASDAEELDGADLDPQELVLHNAQLKASDVANRFSNQWVLGSDTAVALSLIHI